jgi:NAD(P)-dependent dehydrogenase (short-subunit alcohol dehydrogenase family)
MASLRDKVILITGGSTGIGRATALMLGAEGCKVVVAARNRDALEEVAREVGALGGEGLAIPTDVVVPQDCQRAVETTVARFGRLDVLVCSAGVSMRIDFAQTDLAAMEQVVRVNLLGTLYATSFAVPHVKRSRGSLVAVSSLSGLRGVPSYSVYGATKYAVRGLYDSMRMELRRDGVHVGVLAPGFIDTPLRQSVLGPEGKPWPEAPVLPFRKWPVEPCARALVRLIRRRKALVVFPWYLKPLFYLDHIVADMVGDAIIRWKFPPV